MKTLLIVICASLLTIAGWAYFSHFTEGPTGTECSVIRDETDLFMVKPDTAEIFALLSIDSHKWESLNFTDLTFSNVDYNSMYTMYLPDRFIMLSNPGDRDVEIRKYKQILAAHIFAVNKEKSSLPRSSIYGPLVRELNRVASSKAQRKIVIAYTDCRENTDQFSIYKAEYRELLKKNHRDVQKIFEKLAKLNNLSGVTLYIIYKPQNNIDNADFLLMSGVYKQLFEEAGAAVHIGANIVIDNSKR